MDLDAPREDDGTSWLAYATDRALALGDGVLLQLVAHRETCLPSSGD